MADKDLPSTCACGKTYTIDHAMSCVKGDSMGSRTVGPTGQ